MNLLRSLQFHRMRATYIVTGLSFDTCQAVAAASVFSNLTGTRWSIKAFAHGVKDTSRCFPRLNFFCRQFHVALGCNSLSQSVDNDGLLEKLPAIENVKPGREMDSTTAVTADSLLVKGQSPLSKDVLKQDVNSEKPESVIHVDESKREVVVYVGNELVKTKAVDLYKVIRKMDSEEVDIQL